MKEGTYSRQGRRRKKRRNSNSSSSSLRTERARERRGDLCGVQIAGEAKEGTEQGWREREKWVAVVE